MKVKLEFDTMAHPVTCKLYHDNVLVESVTRIVIVIDTNYDMPVYNISHGLPWEPE